MKIVLIILCLFGLSLLLILWGNHDWNKYIKKLAKHSSTEDINAFLKDAYTKLENEDMVKSGRSILIDKIDMWEQVLNYKMT